MLAENSKKRWQKSSKTVDEKTVILLVEIDSAEFHIWQKGHADECDKNFDGTSGAMEMHAALIMWRRSINDYQMRFVSMLSDGDSKTFQFLSDNKIYGSDIKIEKRKECLNHIAKRLGTSLRNKVKEWKRKPKDHSSDFCFCLTTIKGNTSKSKHTVVYPDLQSAMPPIPHSEEFPIPKPPDHVALNEESSYSDRSKEEETVSGGTTIEPSN
ncbi:uncharacterized protein TNCV_3959851 [Trichonephila clavipes]|nr:uncharacterized protein TNCV_3959851 [Trichonephila clavipes]